MQGVALQIRVSRGTSLCTGVRRLGALLRKLRVKHLRTGLSDNLQ